MPGSGSAPNDLVLVGEALGENEEQQGLPFVGRAGDILNSVLKEVGLLRSALFITNSVRCRPLTAMGRNRKPTSHEIDACRGYLVDELRAVQPRVIVALGDVAATTLMGRRLGGVLENRGKITWSDEFNAFIVPTVHPAYVIRRYSERHWLVEDIKTAKRLLDEGLQAPPEVTIDVVRDLDRAYAMADDLCSADRFAYDWETNGVHLTKSEGFCVSFSARRGHAYVVPRYLSGWARAWDDDLLSELDEILRRVFLSDTAKSGHHVSFDNNITKTTLGVWPRNVTFCTMIAHHCLNNHLGERAHGLKVMTALYTPLGRYDDDLDQWLIDNGYTARGRPDMGQLWRAPDDLVHRYNGMDAIATLWCEDVLTPRLKEEKLWDLFTRERMPLVREHQEIDRRGIRIDTPYLDTLSDQLGVTLRELEESISDVAARKINPASHPQVRALLFGDLEMPILGRTEAGEASTKEEVLLQLRDVHPVVPLILRHRAYAKIKGTYVDGTGKSGEKKALRAVVDDDGYARTDTRLHGTETFRFVTRRPFAVHTWPKDQKGMPSVRRLIVPDPGHVFVMADYVQQEFVIQSIAAGQWDMVEALLDRGEDAHERVALDMGGVAKADYLDEQHGVFERDGHRWKSEDAYNEYKKHRSRFKAINFMIMYRGGPRKLARIGLGCTRDPRTGAPCKIEDSMVCNCEAQAAVFIQEYYERYECIKWWQYEIIKELRVSGVVRGLFGAYRRLPGISDSDMFVQLEAERQACNFPIQNGGAHVMIRALLRTQERFRREKFPGRVVVTIHDQLITQVPEYLVEDGTYILRVCMEAPYKELAGRSLRTDVSVVHAWGGS